MARLRQIMGDNGEQAPQDDGGQFRATGAPDTQLGSMNPVPPPPPTPNEPGDPGQRDGNRTSPMEQHMGQEPTQPLSQGHATPPMPSAPSTEGTGTVAPPFQPMPGPGLESLMTSRRRGLYGSTGGLTGGGLGAPTGGGPDQSISALIQALLGRQ